MKRVLARLALAAAAAVAAVLLVEGALSLVAGRSLVRSPLEVADLPLLRDADRLSAVRGQPGLFRVHVDPHVGYTLRADATLEIFDGTAHTDALGLRRRPGPPPPAGARRVVVLGDSVAFGFGVDDDQTLAARLEVHLAARRDPHAPPIVCSTVAVPGWNHRNAVRFLLDHDPQIAPDLVLYVPIGNDLADTDGLYETGHRRTAADPVAREPLLFLHADRYQVYQHGLSLRLAQAGALDRALLEPGTDPMHSDVTRESRRRFDDNARAILLLQERLRGRGAELVVLEYVQTHYTLFLRDRLLAAADPPPWIGLLTDLPSGKSIGHDPHPGPEALDVLARWVAEELEERGLVAAPPVTAPPHEPAGEPWRASRAAPRDAAAVQDAAAAARRELRDSFLPVVDLETGRGALQVCGGLGIDGAAAIRTLIALRRAGDRLTVEAAPLPERPDLFPMQVEVLVEGEPRGVLTVAAANAGPARGSFDVSGFPDVIEVELVAGRWGVLEHHGRTELVSFRPLRLACE